MRTETIAIFKFAELDDESQQRAIEKYMEDQDSDDYIRETIEANEYEFYAGGSMV